MKRILVAALLSVACSRAGSKTELPRATKPATHAAPPNLADESFRAAAPAPEPAAPFAPPVPKEFSLPNGMHVVLIERHDLPLVGLQLLVPHGADDARPRVGSFAMEALFRPQRERLDAVAVRATPWAALDSTGVRLSCVRDKLSAALAIVADAFVGDNVVASDIDIVRSELLAKLEKERSSIAKVHEWAIRDALYPLGHPYREATGDRGADIRSVTRADVMAFRTSHLTPNGMTVIAAGDITPRELEDELTRAFSRWTGPPTFRPRPPPAPARPKTSRIFLIDRPGAAQTHVAVVAPALSRASSDYLPAMIFNRILGGTASSRLHKNLREQKGLTYWASSSISTRHGAGELVAGGAMVREKAGVAVRELLRELELLRTEPVGDDELAAAKEGFIREFPARFEALGGILWIYGEAPVHGLPSDELATRMARIANVTAEELMRIGRTYFDKDALRVVVTGDAGVVRKELEELQLGPIEALVVR